MKLAKWFQMVIIWVIVLCFLIIGAVIINLVEKNNHGSNQTPTTTRQNGKSPSLIWGIDTAGNIKQSDYQCISKDYGKPAFVGRYLGNVNDVSKSLTKDEVNFLHSKGIKILPIHNRFSKALGLENGKKEAEEAIKLAKSVGVKDGVVIMADIEPKFPVDPDFLIGWTDTMLKSKYMPGVYGDFNKNDLAKAYKVAAKRDQSVKDKLILWTNQPSIGVTSQDKAPTKFKGQSPNSDGTLAWQYGIKSKQCNIDADLGKNDLLDLLW